MDLALFTTQMLNGLQLGVLLFLVAAGLTLIFGIMDFINLAHGAFYMLGAYFCGTVLALTDSFLLGVLIAVPLTAAAGLHRRGDHRADALYPRPPGPRAGDLRADPDR